MIRRKAAIFGFLLLACAPLLSAQGYQVFQREIDRIIRDARFRVGPFRIQPALYLTNIGYDNNVYRQASEGDPISDYTANFNPQFNIHLLVGRSLIFSILESPEYSYYKDQERERRWNNTFVPQFKLLFLRRFVLSGQYYHQSRRYRTSSEFDVRANQVWRSYEGSLHYETARESSVGVTYRFNRISYEDITLPDQEIYLSRLLDRDEENITSEIFYRVAPETFLFFRGGYTDFLFKHPSAQNRNAYSYQFTTGLQFPLLGRIRGIAELGYKNLFPRDARLHGFSGFIGNANLDYSIRSFRFRVLYRRDSNFSYWTNNVFYLEDRYGGGISFYVTRFVRVDYNLNYSESFYPETFLVRMPDESYAEFNREDRYFSHGIGLVFRIVRNTGIGLNMTIWERDSNYDPADREQTFIGAYITYDF